MAGLAPVQGAAARGAPQPWVCAGSPAPGPRIRRINLSTRTRRRRRGRRRGGAVGSALVCRSVRASASCAPLPLCAPCPCRLLLTLCCKRGQTMDGCPHCAAGQPVARGRDQVPHDGCALCGASVQGKGPRSGAMWTRRRRSCGHEMDPAAPLEKTSAGAFGVYDPSAHGPRLFDGPAGGPQRVCVLCMLERERWCRRQRDAELGAPSRALRRFLCAVG